LDLRTSRRLGKRDWLSQAFIFLEKMTGSSIDQWIEREKSR